MLLYLARLFVLWIIKERLYVKLAHYRSTIFGIGHCFIRALKRKFYHHEDKRTSVRALVSLASSIERLSISVTRAFQRRHFSCDALPFIKFTTVLRNAHPNLLSPACSRCFGRLVWGGIVWNHSLYKARQFTLSSLRPANVQLFEWSNFGSMKA